MNDRVSLEDIPDEILDSIASTNYNFNSAIKTINLQAMLRNEKINLFLKEPVRDILGSFYIFIGEHQVEICSNKNATIPINFNRKENVLFERGVVYFRNDKRHTFIDIYDNINNFTTNLCSLEIYKYDRYFIFANPNNGIFMSTEDNIIRKYKRILVLCKNFFYIDDQLYLVSFYPNKNSIFHENLMKYI